MTTKDFLTDIDDLLTLPSEEIETLLSFCDNSKSELESVKLFENYLFCKPLTTDQQKERAARFSKLILRMQRDLIEAYNVILESWDATDYDLGPGCIYCNYSPDSEFPEEATHKHCITLKAKEYKRLKKFLRGRTSKFFPRRNNGNNE